MTDEVLDHPRIQAWKKAHPQQWWAFEFLSERSDVRAGVLAAVLAGREKDDEHVDQLVRFGEALENRHRAERVGTVTPPPVEGERRPLQVNVKRMKRMERDGQVFFRVDFSTPYGWSGYFDTTAPSVIERVHKHRHRERSLTIVGEVVRRPHDFLVVLDDRVQIV
jgi:hypothetical protein